MWLDCNHVTIEGISVQSLYFLRGESHGDDVLGHIGQIQVKALEKRKEKNKNKNKTKKKIKGKKRRKRGK